MSWQERTELLLGAPHVARLTRAHVLVVGLGGVGAYAAEMLARAGVGHLTLVDGDVIGVTNLNRQLLALCSTVGLPKATLMAQRLRDINPNVQLTVVERFIKDEGTDELLDLSEKRYDFVVDAIDTLSPKVNLIKGCLDRGLPLVSSMGAGAKLDPTRVQVQDIGRSHHCPLAHMLRKRLHRLGIRSGFPVVFSPEPPRPGALEWVEERNKKTTVGTISYMPAVFGCACASVAIQGLMGSTDEHAIADSGKTPATAQRSNL